MQVRCRPLAAAVVTALAVSCAAAPTPTPTPTSPAVGSLEPSEPFGLTTVTVRGPDDRAALSLPVYDAFTTAARQRGLMYRERLPRRAGMVFRFAEDRSGGFYMKNTLIPLSVVFFDRRGTVVAVRDMEPCTTPTCPTYRPGARYRGALELNQAFAHDLGVEPGWRIGVPSGLPPPE